MILSRRRDTITQTWYYHTDVILCITQTWYFISGLFFNHLEVVSRVALFKLSKFGPFWTSVCNFFGHFLKNSLFFGPRDLVDLSFYSITQTWHFIWLKYTVSVILHQGPIAYSVLVLPLFIDVKYPPQRKTTFFVRHVSQSFKVGYKSSSLLPKHSRHPIISKLSVFWKVNVWNMRRMSEYTSPVGNMVLKKIVSVNIRTIVKTAIVNLTRDYCFNTKINLY